MKVILNIIDKNGNSVAYDPAAPVAPAPTKASILALFKGANKNQRRAAFIADYKKRTDPKLVGFLSGKEFDSAVLASLNVALAGVPDWIPPVKLHGGTANAVVAYLDKE